MGGRRDLFAYHRRIPTPQVSDELTDPFLKSTAWKHGKKGGLYRNTTQMTSDRQSRSTAAVISHVESIALRYAVMRRALYLWSKGNNPRLIRSKTSDKSPLRGTL